MALEHQQTVRSRRRGQRRLLARALAVSALLHVALLALWRVPPPPSPGSDAAAAGEAAPAPPPDDALRVTRVSRPADAGAEVDRPAADRLPEAREPVVREPAGEGLSLEPVPAASAAPRLAMGTGEGSSAQGAGSAGSPGEPGRISPPVPRTILPEWNPPERVRGTRVTVRVEVGRDGRPTGRAQLEPPTPSEAFNRRLREAMTSLRYRPATRAGEPVLAWAEVTFVF